MVRLKSAVLVFFLVVFAAGAHAQVTSLTLVSDPGDFVGSGETLSFTPADGLFVANVNFDNGVSVQFFGPGSNFWQLDFAAANFQPLTDGSYTGVARYPFQPSTQPGLSVVVEGRGCNTVIGSFTVLEASYSDGVVNAFDATFEQHCEGDSAALRGEIRFNANPTVVLTGPGNLRVLQNQNVHFNISSSDVQGRHVVLTATGLPQGATFLDNGDNTGTFNWTPNSNQSGDFPVTFHGDNLTGDSSILVTQFFVFPPPPPNDELTGATVIPSIPFTVSQAAGNATNAPDDPACGGNQSVWFSFTPTQNMRIEANTFGSNYDTVLGVYTGMPGALTQIGCNDDDNVTVQSRVRFDAVAGITYFFMVSAFFTQNAGDLTFNLLQAPPQLTITPSVFKFGSVDPLTGNASISGSISCSEPTTVTISGFVKQMHGGIPLSGVYAILVFCDGTTLWNAGILTDPKQFHGRALDLFAGGKANVFFDAQTFDFQNGETVERNGTATIILRPKK